MYLFPPPPFPGLACMSLTVMVINIGSALKLCPILKGRPKTATFSVRRELYPLFQERGLPSRQDPLGILPAVEYALVVDVRRIVVGVLTKR